MVVAALLLPQASLAVIVNVRVVAQPLALSACVTVITTALHASIAVTSAFTLASVGRLPDAGLHPKLLPLGAPVSVGAVVSTTVIVWLAVAVLPQSSVAVHVRVTE